ncbi:hypothetical protein ACFOOM_10320 [Streptomyces echinoruber]|uniref:Secreted protein n=1 Tax=Streptomyces echinoruber TaxID=68898 RepID=A0A918VRC3_9ACTN|nr:hypothetical protein [Streptomyces echinoruber]GHA16060.1 hypothetical protein GCM10010389_63320 [Streptomyces echinoruber]
MATIGAFVAATSLTVTPALAANAATPTKGEIAAALKRHSDGTWTRADVDLIRSIPELAAVVPDVTRPEEVSVVSAVIGPDDQAVSDRDGQPLSPAELAKVLPPEDAEPSAPSQVQVTPEENDIDSAMMKREVELCVFKYGCYSTLHPWAKVKVYGSGKTAIGGSGV